MPQPSPRNPGRKGKKEIRAATGLPAGEPALTVREVASTLGVHTETVYRVIGRGELPAVRVGSAWRILPADLQRYLRRS